MFATHSWWSCTGTFPKTSWTKAGPRPQLLSPRYTGGQQQQQQQKKIYLKDHVFCFVSSNGVKTVVVFRHRSIYESCACRTWCGATVRRSVLSGSTRSVSSQHLSLRVHCVDSYASSNCHDSSVNRWSRRRSPVNSSRTRRTTTPRVSPNSFSAQDSVRCTRTAALKDEWTWSNHFVINKNNSAPRYWSLNLKLTSLSSRKKILHLCLGKRCWKRI